MLLVHFEVCSFYERYKESYLKNLTKECFKKGYLKNSIKGLPGGFLTSKSLKILNSL